MKLTKKVWVCATIVLISVITTAPTSFAVSPAQLKKVRQTLKEIKRLENRLKALLANFDSTGIARLSIPGRDSDEDGLMDLLEYNTDLCDPDSDDDGLEDSEEEFGGSEPDGDGSDDQSTYFEHLGIVEARNEVNMKVGSQYFSLAGTKYLNGSYEPIPSSEIVAGDCVLVKAEEAGNVDVAVIVKELIQSECAG